jgi:2-succinyl-6-hydroxy-2,4-cyclohexadiene-1-carboxylate synthase
MKKSHEECLIFASGFLGQAKDGDFLKNLFSRYEGLDFFSPSALMEEILQGHKESAEDLSKNFFHHLALKIHEQIKNQTTSEKQYLLGYSLGGRVLAHVFLQNPDSFKKIFLVSSHMGLETHEKQGRLLADHVWAEKFQNQPWDQVLTAWNKQKIFDGSSEPSKVEKDFSRKALAAAFQYLSLGLQRNLELELSQHQEKIVYICGANDEKFVELGKKYSKLGFQTNLIPNCGHRILQQQPENLRKIIQMELDQSNA